MNIIKLKVSDYLASVKVLNKNFEIAYTFNHVDSINEIRFETYFSNLNGRVLITDGIVTSNRTETVRKDDTICSIEKIHMMKGGARWVGIISHDENGISLNVLTTEDDMNVDSFNGELISSFCRI